MAIDLSHLNEQKEVSRYRFQMSGESFLVYRKNRLVGVLTDGQFSPCAGYDNLANHVRQAFSAYRRYVVEKRHERDSH